MHNLAFKVLALCAFVVGSSSIGVGSASAESNVFWFVNGTEISEALLPALGATAENGGLTVLTKLGSKNIHLLCTGVVLEEAHLVEPEGQFLGKAKFSGCKFLELLTGGGTKEIKACNPKEGKVTTNKVKGSITSSEGKGSLTLTPAEGTTFVNVFLGEECGFGEKLNVGGSLVLKDAGGELAVSRETHLFEADSVLTKLWANSESNPATIDGSANAFLTGTHEGLKWGGQPG